MAVQERDIVMCLAGMTDRGGLLLAAAADGNAGVGSRGDEFGGESDARRRNGDFVA
jgi:hypothetical protein